MPDEATSVVRGLGFRPEEEGDEIQSEGIVEVGQEEQEQEQDYQAAEAAVEEDVAEEPQKSEEKVSLIDSLRSISGETPKAKEDPSSYWRQKYEAAEREKTDLLKQWIEKADKALLGPRQQEEEPSIDWQESPELSRVLEEQGFEPDQARVAVRFGGLMAEKAVEQAIRRFETQRLKPLEERLSEHQTTSQQNETRQQILSNFATAAKQLEGMTSETRELVEDLRHNGARSFLGRVWAQSSDAQRSPAHAVALAMGLVNLAKMRGEASANGGASGVQTSALAETASSRGNEPTKKKPTVEQQIAAEISSVRKKNLGDLSALLDDRNWG